MGRHFPYMAGRAARTRIHVSIAADEAQDYFSGTAAARPAPILGAPAVTRRPTTAADLMLPPPARVQHATDLAALAAPALAACGGRMPEGVCGPVRLGAVQTPGASLSGDKLSHLRPSVAPHATTWGVVPSNVRNGDGDNWRSHARNSRAHANPSEHGIPLTWRRARSGKLCGPGHTTTMMVRPAKTGQPEYATGGLSSDYVCRLLGVPRAARCAARRPRDYTP